MPQAHKSVDPERVLHYHSYPFAPRDSVVDCQLGRIRPSSDLGFDRICGGR